MKRSVRVAALIAAALMLLSTVGCSGKPGKEPVAPIVSAAAETPLPTPSPTPEPDVMVIYTPEPLYEYREVPKFSDMNGMPEEWGAARLCDPFLVTLGSDLKMTYEGDTFTVSGMLAGKTELYTLDLGEEKPTFEVRAIVFDKANTVIKWTGTGGFMNTLQSGESGEFTISGTVTEKIVPSDVITLVINTTAPIPTDTQGSGICIVGGSNVTLNAANVVWPDSAPEATPAAE